MWLGSLVAAHAQTTMTASPTADAFVTNGPDGSLADDNYGGGGSLSVSGAMAERADAGPQGTFDSVMRFDIAASKASFDAIYGAGSWTVQSVTLQLFTAIATNSIFNSNAAGQFGISWMQNDSWVEGVGTPNGPDITGITYNSLPGLLGSGNQSLGTFAFDPAISGADGASSSYDLSLAGPGNGLVADMLAGNLVSFEFFAVSNSMSYVFNSGSFKTEGRRPILSITAAVVPEPPACLLLAAGCAFLTAVTILGGARVAGINREAFR